jgi:hypothetical protein
VPYTEEYFVVPYVLYRFYLLKIYTSPLSILWLYIIDACERAILSIIPLTKAAAF